jgi:hypothetical protein
MSREVAADHARMMAGYYQDSRRPDRSFMKLTEIAMPLKVSVAPDGSLMMTLMTGLSGAPMHYREVAPFVWRDVNSGWRMAAKVVDGRVVRISMDELSPFMVFDPMPGSRSPAWLLPALGVALGACLLTSLLWPVAAISRRRHRVRLPIEGLALRGHKLSRIAAVALSAVTAGWATLLIMGTKDLDFLSPALDPVLILMYALSVVVYFGGAAAMLWATWVAWATARPVTARLWTVVLALSSLVLLYFALVYHLMSFVTKY